MITKDLISQFKQTNISVDADITRERVKALWRDAASGDKEAVLDLVDLKITSIYRVFQKGNISVKVVAAIAQTFKVNPYYLTGESSKESGFSDKVLEKFLCEKVLGDNEYEKLIARIAEAETGEPTPGISAPADTEAAPVHIEPVSDSPALMDDIAKFYYNAFSKLSCEQKELADSMTFDEAMALLTALAIKSRANGQKDTVARLVKLLLVL